MKENLLQKWCDQAWLHCIYLIGIIMGNILLIKWPVWEVPQRLICLLAIMVPLHVFEENTAPGGFFYMNNLGQKSDAPLVYPPEQTHQYVHKPRRRIHLYPHDRICRQNRRGFCYRRRNIWHRRTNPPYHGWNPYV